MKKFHFNTALHFNSCLIQEEARSKSPSLRLFCFYIPLREIFVSFSTSKKIIRLFQDNKLQGGHQYEIQGEQQ